MMPRCKECRRDGKWGCGGAVNIAATFVFVVAPPRIVSPHDPSDSPPTRNVEPAILNNAS
jgi:hypothetical protein